MNKITLALASAATLALSVGALSAGAVSAQAPASAGAGSGADNADNGADLTRAQVEQRTGEMFAQLDANKDGKLDAADRTLLQAERAKRLAERQNERFAQLDTDKNGSLSRAEFDAGLDRARERVADRGADGKRGGPRGKGGKGGPGMAKLDGDKAMTQAEFTAAALARFDRADTNRDGTVTAAERKAQSAARRAARTDATS